MLQDKSHRGGAESTLPVEKENATLADPNLIPFRHKSYAVPNPMPLESQITHFTYFPSVF